METWQVVKDGGPAWQGQVAIVDSNDATGGIAAIRGVSGKRIVVDDVLLSTDATEAGFDVELHCGSTDHLLLALPPAGVVSWSPRNPLVGDTGETFWLTTYGTAGRIVATLNYHLEAQAVTGTPSGSPDFVTEECSITNDSGETPEGSTVILKLEVSGANADDTIEIWRLEGEEDYALVATLAPFSVDFTEHLEGVLEADGATYKARYARNGVYGDFSEPFGVGGN